MDEERRDFWECGYAGGEWWVGVQEMELVVVDGRVIAAEVEAIRVKHIERVPWRENQIRNHLIIKYRWLTDSENNKNATLNINIQQLTVLIGQRAAEEKASRQEIKVSTKKSEAEVIELKRI